MTRLPDTAESQHRAPRAGWPRAVPLSHAASDGFTSLTVPRPDAQPLQPTSECAPSLTKSGGEATADAETTWTAEAELDDKAAHDTAAHDTAADEDDVDEATPSGAGVLERWRPRPLARISESGALEQVRSRALASARELGFLSERPSSVNEHIEFALHGDWTVKKSGPARWLHLLWALAIAIPVTVVGGLIIHTVQLPGRCLIIVVTIPPILTALNFLPIFDLVIWDGVSLVNWPVSAWFWIAMVVVSVLAVVALVSFPVPMAVRIALIVVAGVSMLAIANTLPGLGVLIPDWVSAANWFSFVGV